MKVTLDINPALYRQLERMQVEYKKDSGQHLTVEQMIVAVVAMVSSTVLLNIEAHAKSKKEQPDVIRPRNKWRAN